jgi:hypothetical protein
MVDLFEKLLDKKIRLDVLDIDGRTILFNCIKFNYIELIKLFIKK